uniref:Arf family protein n=1 Tax=Volvariella volvacea TaxID=36659 RepID=A0A1B2U725_9AGAR|nr:Arf family protein [Volvariella volvacea]
MASVIQRLTQRLFPKNKEYAVTILGLGASGKTTLLYLLFTGQIVQTIPSIGTNVETVSVQIPTGKLSFIGWDIGLGCSDIHQMHGLISSYTTFADAMVWMIDSSLDREWLGRSIEELQAIVKTTLKKKKRVRRDRQSSQYWSNKQDLPNAIPVDEIRIKISRAMPRHVLSVFKTSLTAPFEASGLPEAFGWLSIALQATVSKKPNAASAPGIDTEQITQNPHSSDPLLQRISDWVVRSDSDSSSPEEFLSQFENLQLPSWDHYTHIRIAYIILTLYGRQKGKDMIFEGIEKYITQSSQTRMKTFHTTMTYFWIQIIHFGIISTMTIPTISTSQQPSSPASKSTIAGIKQKPPPTPLDFPRFLIQNPHVADPNLWSEFYSKELMMSPGAKQAMVQPDKKPLPSLVK